MTTWETMTLRQFQAITKIQASKMDDLDRQTEILSILTGKTPRQLDDMPLADYRTLAKQMHELLTGFKKMPGKPQRYIAGFKIPYQVHKMTQGQWVTLMHFTATGDTIGNAHNILATIANPVKKIGPFHIERKNDASKHADYAELFLDAKVIDVYHSCLFFCQMFRNLLQDIRAYLVGQLMQKGIGMKQAWETIQGSIQSMDGFIQQNKLLNLTA